MEIVGTTTPDKIPAKKFDSKKFLPIQKAVATLTPGEVLKIKIDYPTQGYTIRDKISKWFPNAEFEAVTRKIKESHYLFIHYKSKVK